MIRKKGVHRIIATVLAAALFIAAATTAVYAWLINPTRSNAIVKGSIKGSYFEDGTGTKDDPYIIAREIQLYYLAWLQNIGYFNRESVVAGEEGTVRQFYFKMDGYNYQRNGIESSETVKNGVFDMSSYHLPPIGTTEYPFVGYFDGNGCVIDGLTVTNQFIESDHVPKEGGGAVGTQAIGFFGVVGTYNGTAGTIGSGANALTYLVSDNEVTNFILSDLTVKSISPTAGQTLVGVAAGYVNGAVTQVGVCDSRVEVDPTATGALSAITENKSDFGLIGYCTEPFKQTLRVEKVSVATPTYTQNILYKNTQGEGAGFGGSIRMRSVYDRLVSVFNDSAEYAQFVNKEYWTINEQTNTSVHHTDRDEIGVNYSIKSYYPSGTDLSYTFSTYSSNPSGASSTTYMYLFGEDTVGYDAAHPNTAGIIKTVETERYKRIIGVAYRIIGQGSEDRIGGGSVISYTSGGTTYYLNFNGTSFSSGTDPYTATAWTVPTNSGSGTISTVIGGTTYYLRQQNNTTLTYSATLANATTWTRSNNGRLYVRSGSYYYFIQYSGGSWETLGRTTRTNSITTLTISAAQQQASYYLNLNAAGTALTAGTDAFLATPWLFDASGSIYTIVNETVCYLNVTGNTTISAGAVAESTWTFSNGRLYASYNGSNRYLRYNGGWEVNSNVSYAAAVNREQAAAIDEWAWDTEIETVGTSFQTNPTYFALNMSDGYTTSDMNTGYIVSGANYQNTSATNSAERYPSKSGDIRVSEYSMSSISTATNGSVSTYTATTDSRLEILTAVNFGGYNGFYRIQDANNENNNSVHQSLSGYTKVHYSALGLKRYADARAAMSETFLNSSGIYGLHFMNATIGTSIITIPQAIINGEQISSLEVPSDCIDFNVKNRGFLTILAGTYFPGNTSFFSLHEIFRNSDNTISEIKEISELYQPLHGTNDYIYRYSDGTYSASLTAEQIASLVLAFDMEWMTNPSVMIENAVYYFEIPVNSGEFALGSVEGKNGAYLFYLDIAANGGQIEDKARVTVAEQIVSSSAVFTSPKGVQLIDFDPATAIPDEDENGNITGFASTTSAIDDLESVAIRLQTGFSGIYPLVRSGTEFQYLLCENAALTFLGGSLTARSTDGGSVPVTGSYILGGYTVTFVETITDVGRETANSDIMRVETVDSYDENGNRTGRVVTIYAGLDVEPDASALIKIASFAYDPTGHDDMVTRVVRGASIGGFNVAFSEIVSVTSTYCNENAHVNFGNNLANILITLDFENPLTNQTVDAVELDGSTDFTTLYRKSTVGDLLATYYYYSSPDAEIVAETAPSFSEITAASTAQTLSYGISIVSSVAIRVRAVLKKDISEVYATTVFVQTADGTTTEEKIILMTIETVTVNSVELTVQNETVMIPVSAGGGS